MRQVAFGSSVAVGLLVLSSSLLAQGSSTDGQGLPAAAQVALSVSGSAGLADGSILVAPGLHAANLDGPAGDVYAGIFVWTALRLGEFELVAEGLLAHGPLNGAGDFRAPVNVPVELAGSIITARGFSTPDYRLIHGSPVYTFRIL